MTDHDPTKDDELSRRLAAWRAPDPPAGLDARVLASYRSGEWKPLSWQFLLKGSVRVPLPVAIAAALLLCALSLLVVARSGNVGAPAAAVGAPGTNGETAPSPEPREKDLAGFEPAREMKVTILRRGEAR